MPYWSKLAIGWALAAITAIAFSWGAVAQVRNQVIEPSIEIPTTVAAAPSAVASTTTSEPRVIGVEPEGPGTSTTVSTASTPTASTTGDGTGTSSTTTTTTPPGGTSTTQPPPATSTTTSTTTTSTTQPPGTTTTTSTTQPPQTETATYQLTGGVVTISYSAGVVNLVSAIPQAGFSTDVKHSGPREVRVRFESSSHESDFRAEWESGELTIAQSENDKG